MEAQTALKIEVTKTFKRVLLDKDLKQYEAAENLGMDKRPFNRLIQKDNDLRVHELIRIADSMSCDVRLSFVDKDTGKEWQCDVVESASGT